MLEMFWSVGVGLDEMHSHCDDSHDGPTDEIALVAGTQIDVEPFWNEDRLLLEREHLLGFCALAFPAGL